MSCIATDNMITRRLMGLVALLCIAVQFRGSLLLSLAALVVWIGMLAILDRSCLQRMWMPRFWLITIVVAIGSGLLLGQRDTGLLGLPLSRSGLEAGVLMVLRGAFIFGIAAWASRALDEELVARAAKRLGIEPLGRAIPVALKLLPELQTRLRRAAREARESHTTKRRHLLARGYEISVELVCQTARLAGQISEASNERKVAGVIGSRGAGKTTTLFQIALLLEERGLEVGGVVQPAVHEFPSAARTGYLLRDVHSGEDRVFARRREGSGFDFDPDGWDWARQRILQARSSMDVVVVDELGRLEAKGEGHLPGLEVPIEAERARIWLLGVRADQASVFEERLGPFALTLRLDVGKNTDEISSFIEQIEELLQK